MESYSLSVHGRCQGILFQNRIAVPWNGPILTITSGAPCVSSCQNTGFARTAVDRTGTRIAAGDYQGNIYVFDRRRNRFWFVCHLDHCSSCIAFTPCRGNDLIVASSDCSVCFMDSESCSVKNSYNFHQTCVNHISLDADGKRAVTSSLDVAIMWDICQLSILHKLNLRKNVDIIKAFFLPAKDHLVSAFKDGSVFLWDSSSLQPLSKFVCDEEDPSWLRTADGSKDGSLIICGGKKDQIIVWSVENQCFLYSVSLAKYLKCVKHVAFLSSSILSKKPHLVSILSHEGKLYICDIDTAEYCCELKESHGKITAFTEGDGKVALITSSAALKFYDLQSILREDKKPVFKRRSQLSDKLQVKEVHVKQKVVKKPKEDEEKLSRNQLLSILSTFGEYPSKYRFIIWSELLELPKNEEYIVFYKDNNINIHTSNLVLEPAVQRAFGRIFSMLNEWCPFLKSVDYMPLLILPFIKVLHKNILICFELLVTFIVSWCQNWFLYLPFLPFNVLCVIENLLLYHDRLLLHHFLLHDLPPEDYAFTLLRSSFSEVFNEQQWLQLWDNIFSNSPDFIIYIVVSFCITSREVLLRCSTKEDLKAFYSRHSALASNVIRKAHHIRSVTPLCFDPAPIIGSFVPLPRGGYPAFNRFTLMESDLGTLEKHRILDSEFESLRNRKEQLQSDLNEKASSGRLRSELLKLHLLELKKLQELMREIILQSVDPKRIEKLEEVEHKVEKVQKLIQQNLVDQVLLFKFNVETDCKIKDQQHINETSSDSDATGMTKQGSHNSDCAKAVMDVLKLREIITQNNN